MQKQFLNYGKICSICLLATTVLAGCSSWGNKPPPRYNTVQGGRHAPALNPGGTGHVRNPLAIATKPKPQILAPMPEPKHHNAPLIDEETRRMLFSDVSEHQISAPVEPVTTNDYPVLSDVPNISQNTTEHHHAVAESIKNLTKDGGVSNKTPNNITALPTTPLSPEPLTIPSAEIKPQEIINSKSSYNPEAKYMAGERLPDNMTPWTAEGTNTLQAVQIPTHPTLIAPIEDKIEYTDIPVLSEEEPVVSLSTPTPYTSITPADDSSATPWIDGEAKVEVEAEAKVETKVEAKVETEAETKVVSTPTPITWEPVTPEIPTASSIISKLNHSETNDIINDHNTSSQPIAVSEINYPSPIAEEFAIAPITLAPPQNYGLISEKSLGEPRYAKRLRKLRRGRRVTQQ